MPINQPQILIESWLGNREPSINDGSLHMLAKCPKHGP